MTSVFGGEGNDSLTGSSSDDLILGFQGDDSLIGLAGNDSIYGGMGADTLLGDRGNDLLLGNRGNDVLYGGQGDDSLYGGKGNDLLIGGLGNDFISGDQGDDTASFAGTRSSYTITTNSAGDFILSGGDGTDTVSTVEHFQFSDGTFDAATLIQGTSGGGGGGGTTPVPPAPPAPSADLGITATVSNATPNVGDQITFTDTLTNGGPNDATGVTASDTLTSGLTFVSATPSTGTYNPATGVWTVGTVANGSAATLIIAATVNGPGTQTNTASITGSTPADPHAANNSASASETSISSNAAPVANDDFYSVPQDSYNLIGAPGVLSNDTDANPGDTLTAQANPAVLPQHGSVTLNSSGSFSYTPNPGFLGLDSFGYFANDGTTNSNPAVVSIAVGLAT